MHKKYFIREEDLSDLERASLRAIMNRLDALYFKLSRDGKADIVIALEESDVIQESSFDARSFFTGCMISLVLFTFILLLN
jgi:hypothetical protein